MGAGRFLLLGESDIQRALGGAGLDEGVVIAGIEREFAALQMQNEFGGGVQKIAVMADDDHRAAILLEKILQPQHAFQIQIVGGFVQQQKIGGREQDRGQRHAHAPAAGKFAAGAHLIPGGKSQARQNLGGAGGRGIGVDGVQAGINVAQLVTIGLMLGRGQKPGALRIGLQHRVDQADITAGRFLRHRAHAPGIGPAHLAVIGVKLPQDHLEQGGFSRTVAADQADPPARGKIGGGAGQDFPPRDPHHDVVDCQHLGAL